MQIREPLYQFTTQAGKYSWLFATIATWILGFLTWQVMYIIESTASGQKLDPSLPGPNSFTSVLIGDFLVLPVINALIVRFYQIASSLGKDLNSTVYSRTPVIGSAMQNSIAAIIALAVTVGTYFLWFSVKKVDWSIPKPGTPNAAGWYHAIFMATEIYFVSNFILSAAYVFLRKPKPDNKSGFSIALRRRWIIGILPLVRIFGGIGIATDVFTLALLIDVYHQLIPVTGYFATAVLVSLLTSISTLVIILGVYKRFLNILFHDIWAPLLLLAAIVGAIGLPWAVLSAH